MMKEAERLLKKHENIIVLSSDKDKLNAMMGKANFRFTKMQPLFDDKATNNIRVDPTC